MARTEKYFLGPGLLSDIRQALLRVDAIAPSTSGLKSDVLLDRLPEKLGGGKAFRIATFTGAWSKGSLKVVTLSGVTTTISAVNLFLDVTVDCGTRNCGIAKDGTAWYLIAAECG